VDRHYVAKWLCDAYAKRARTPENQPELWAGLGLKVLAFGLRQRTHPALKPQMASSAAVQDTTIVDAKAYIPYR
jgi:hypothetical protein